MHNPFMEQPVMAVNEAGESEEIGKIPAKFSYMRYQVLPTDPIYQESIPEAKIPCDCHHGFRRLAD